MSATSHPQLLTERELSEFLREHLVTTRKRRLAGQGPRYCRVGGAIRYRLEDVMDWIEALTVDPSTSSDREEVVVQ